MVVAVSLMVLAGHAEASPIGSFKWSYDVLLGTASALSLTSLESSARLALFTPGQSLPFQAPTIGLVVTPGAIHPSTLLVSSVAAPLPPAFQEPSAWVIVLIGLGVVGLGSVRRRLTTR
jgi:hypothetical protein